MREFQDLMDFFPYCLLVALPVFIALSPMPVHAVSVAAATSTTTASAYDFPVHRYEQYKLKFNFCMKFVEIHVKRQICTVVW